MIDLTPNVQRAFRSVPFAVCALALGACTSPSASKPRASEAKIVEPAQLPQDLRATWEVYRRGGAAWDVERERVRADPERLRFLIDNVVIEMVRSYERSRLRTAGEVDGPFERAQRELVVLSDASTPILVELLAARDGIVAFLAADVLAQIGAPALDRVCALLSNPKADVRRRAAELLARLPHGGEREPAIDEALGARVKDDEEWIVRAQAALALGERGARHEHKGYCLAVLSRALADPDPAVVSSACQGLQKLGERRAIPALAESLARSAERGELKCMRAAQDALRALSGRASDMDPAAWSRWWRSEASRSTETAKPAGD